MKTEFIENIAALQMDWNRWKYRKHNFKKNIRKHA